MTKCWDKELGENMGAELKCCCCECEGDEDTLTKINGEHEGETNYVCEKCLEDAEDIQAENYANSKDGMMENVE